LAAVMSSCDAFMMAGSALFTENVLRKTVIPHSSDRFYMFVGRLVGGVIVAGGILFAFSLESVVKGLEVFWKVSAMMGLAFWAGYFWRRTTVAGAWAGTLVSFAGLLFTSKISVPGHVLWDFNATIAEYLPGFMLWEGKLYLPWQMIFYLVLGLVTMVVVSLFTAPVPKEKLERFYGCLRTPVGPDEPETEPFTLPPGVEPPPRRVLVDLPGFEIPMPSRVGVLGVAGFVAAVIAFVIGVKWIFSLGA